MAKDVTIVVPIEEGNGTKLVAVEAKVSEGTIAHNGEDYHIVKHTNSGFNYLADEALVDELENNELADEMKELMTEEGF